MRVAFISRATLHSAPGGDTEQLLQTAANLRELGVEVDVYLTNEQIDYKQYDLLHFFNIIRPADIIKHIQLSKKQYVVSTIFVDYGTVPKESSGMIGALRKVFSDNGLEYIKAIARYIKNGEKIVSNYYLLHGHKASIKYVAEHAAMLLPNSESEYKRFQAKYNIPRPYRVVPNGINMERISKNYPVNEAYTGAVICMGRIEVIKNQLNLIRALNNTSYKLFIHGKPSPNGGAYYEQCKEEAADNVVIGAHLGSDELYAAYNSASVHVLPSYFETTGLSSLEAAVMGCNIVVTDRGDAKEYYQDDAWYCEPDDPVSIKAAVDKAYNAPYNDNLKKRILNSYTWQKAAEETLAAYKEVLNK